MSVFADSSGPTCGCPVDGCDKTFKTERGMKCHLTTVHEDRPYTDESWLQERYVEREMDAEEIASELTCDGETIRRWAKRFGFARDKSDAGKLRIQKAESHNLNERSIHPNVFTRKDSGYVVASCGVNKEQFKLHRLLATLHVGDIDELQGQHVHHKSCIPWDNRPDNFEILRPGEHTHIHHRHTPEELLARKSKVCGLMGCSKRPAAVIDHPKHGERTVCQEHAGDHEVVRRV